MTRKLKSKVALSQDGDGPHCHLRGEQEVGGGAGCVYGGEEPGKGDQKQCLTFTMLSPQTSEKTGEAERQIWPGVQAT